MKLSYVGFYAGKVELCWIIENDTANRISVASAHKNNNLRKFVQIPNNKIILVLLNMQCSQSILNIPQSFAQSI